MIIIGVWSRESLPRTVDFGGEKGGGIWVGENIQNLDQEDEEEKEDLMRQDVDSCNIHKSYSYVL